MVIVDAMGVGSSRWQATKNEGGGLMGDSRGRNKTAVTIA